MRIEKQFAEHRKKLDVLMDWSKTAGLDWEMEENDLVPVFLTSPQLPLLRRLMAFLPNLIDHMESGQAARRPSVTFYVGSNSELDRIFI